LFAHVALRAAGEAMGYPELAQLSRRFGHPDQVRVGAHGHEASIANALSEARAFGLSDAVARQTVA
jgi:hypothetical protein